MSKILKWFLMLSKRLYKKPSFVVLLILIPACVLAFSLIADDDSGFVHIVLAQSNNNDSISSEVINQLLNENSIINFTLSDNPESAIAEVENGLADEAWVFPVDTLSGVEDFVGGGGDYVVSVVTREQNVSLRIAREKLTAALYKYCAKAYYIDYIRANISQLDALSDEQLTVYFENVKVDEELFVFGNPADVSNNSADANYLLSPIRGLLAILAVICAMAATMYYMQDELAGTFSYVKQKQKGLTALGCVLTAVINVSVVLFLSLCLSSLMHNVFKEILALLLYALCCSAFCLLLKQIFSSLRTYAAVIPLFAIIFIGVCPVFFDFRSLSFLQMLLPPTYYVNAIYNNTYFIGMIVYTAVCFALSLALKSIKSAIKTMVKSK